MHKASIKVAKNHATEIHKVSRTLPKNYASEFIKQV
jgi:hypothetical protein